MVYDPKTKKYPYPEDTGAHYITIKKNNGVVFDRDYRYVDRSRSFLFRQALVRFVLNALVFPAMFVRLGLKIEGRENLKKHKEELDRGVISCCNHVHFWDYIAIMRAVRPKKPYVLTWDKNITGENGGLIRMAGGIPIPEDGIGGSVSFLRSIRDLLESGGWLHVYGEGSMWEYYCPIRPFKKGAAYFACKYDRPLLPLAFSYRKPGWIRRKVFRQIALFTLHIGEPLYKDPSLPKEEQIRDLTKRCHEEVCRLAGIDPAENLYPPIYEDSKKVEYY